VGHAEPPGVGFEPVAQDPVADEHEADLGILSKDFGGGGEDVVVPLPLEQSGDRGEGDLVGVEAQFPPDFIPRPGRVEERVDVHPAVDGGILLGAADPGEEGLLGHRVADADDGVAPSARPLFQGNIKPVLERRLARAEREAVDRVDHGRNALVPRGASADDPRLRRVGVDHLGPEATERFSELPVGFEIGPGPDRPDQFGHHLDVQAARLGPGEQVPLGAFRRAGDQDHVVAVVVMQPVDGEQGIFLGTTEDQASDDVDDAHRSGVFPGRSREKSRDCTTSRINFDVKLERPVGRLDVGNHNAA